MTQTKSKIPLPAQTDRSRRNRWIIAGAAFIVLTTLVVYLPALRAGYIWDDEQHITDNANLRTVQGLVEIWTDPWSIPQWYPLVHTTFWIEYQLWGLHPLGYHLVNVLLHITSALLLWRLLWMLKVPGAWVAGAIFALHPVQVESVAWITERKNVLSCVFYLWCLLTYLRTEGKSNYVLVILLFLAALLSKSVTATLPAAILVILWWKYGSVGRREIVRLIPLFILGIGMGLFTAYLEVNHVGARSDSIVELNLTWLDRIVLAGRVICFYAAKLAWPHPLIFIYPQWKVDSHIAWQWVFPIGMAVMLIILILARNKITRGPAAAMMLFCGTLFPVLGFVNVYPFRFSYVADHFQYHASLALIALAAAGLAKIPLNLRAALAGGILAIFATLTCLQTTVYKDAQTLWRYTIKKNPDSWMVNTNLALLLREQAEKTNDPRDFAEMGTLFEHALKMAPDIRDTRTNYGMELGRRGELDAALLEFQRAIQLDPNFAPAYYGMGQVYQRQKNYPLAIQNLQKAIDLLPNYWLAYLRLGMILEETGNLADAREAYAVAADGLPENFDAHYNLGNTCITLGYYAQAQMALSEAARIRPASAEAWNNLGFAQYRMGRSQQAIQSLQKALSLKPDLQQARMLLQQMGQR